MNDKKTSRLRRARRARAKIRQLEAYRLTVNRTPRHIYAQVFSQDGTRVVASASTLDKGFAGKITGNQEAAQQIGKLVAERAKEAGITAVAFDRSGYKYHGRVKALADAARESGLEF